MDGTLAAIFAIASLADLAVTHCPMSCLDRRSVPAQYSLRLGDVHLDESRIATELTFGVAAGVTVGPFHPVAAASVTEDGTGWIGLGARLTSADILPGPVFVESTFMPGAAFKGGGPDLGGNLQFRSSLGFGLAFANGSSVSIAYDHRSNADIRAVNPGLEVLSIGYAIPF